MALRGSISQQRNLTLTEELEKLEQTITLTLQEIDHNFSRAHRIVTTSILPIVEQYAKHSDVVWEGSKFWKQFFEASANVSLSGYEELAQQDEQEGETTVTQGHDETYATTQHADETVRTDASHHNTYDHDDSLMDSNDISGSTPRRPQSNAKPEFQHYDSPYEALKRELKPQSKYHSDEEEEEETTQPPPATPGTEQRLPRMSMAPESSPFGQTSYLPSDKRHDPLLHRVMDRNYRLQATPHTAQKEKAKTPLQKPSWRDMGSPGSSSPLQAPTLHHEVFSSPVRQPALTPRSPSAKKQALYSQINAPRTPGISVQTPAARHTTTKHEGFADIDTGTNTTSRVRDEITWDSDSDDDEDIYKTLGMSPPKTIQFALPPSRLVQTPARDASRRIVEDLYGAAGGRYVEMDEDSPSMVRPTADRGAFDDTTETF